MKERTRVRKSAEAETKPTNRLTGITVNEVSIVDLAANQKKFLVVKDAAPPAAPPPPAPATPPPAPAPSLTISPELKAKVTGVLKTAQEKIAVLAKALEVAVETPGAPAPKELMDALAGISGLFAATPAAPAPPAPPGPPTPPVQKAGKKISASRLEQLLTAKTALDAILAEVADPETETEPEPEKTEKNEPAALPVEPAVPPVTTDLTEIRTSIEQLAGMVGKLTLVFEGQNQRIDSLAKARGQSQQVEIDKTTPQQRVVWDMDMAKPPKTVQ
jgi:hypothetical protein